MIDKKIALEVRNLASMLIRKHHREVMQYLDENVGERTVTQIYEAVGIEQSECSQVLAAFRKHQLVKVRRNGKQQLYQLNRTRLFDMNIKFTALTRPLSSV